MALWNFSAPARDWRHWKNITPVHPVAGLLHQHPWAAVAERAHKVAGHRRPHAGVGIRRVLIDVVADYVFMLRPLPVVERLEEAHEVGRDGDAGTVLGEDGVLELVTREQLVGRKTHEVELLARVRPGGRSPRR